MGGLKCKTNNFLCVGDLQFYITIQTRILTSPTDIDIIETYTKLADVWASVTTKAITAPMSKTNTNEDITHFFYIRYRTDITIDNWILLDNKRYKIVAVKDIDFFKNFLEMRCIFKGDISEDSSKW